MSTKEHETTMVAKPTQRGAGTPQTWYINTKPDARQGLIIDENTGASIAVSYDPKDAQLIASAPMMLRTLQEIENTILANDCKNVSLRWIADKAQEAAREATDQ